MRYQITKSLNYYGTTEFLADCIIDLLTHCYCEFVNPRETTVDINDNFLEISGLESPKRDDKYCKKRKNYGYADWRNSKASLCLIFYNGTHCDKLIMPKDLTIYSSGKILEVNYKKDESIDEVMPCGHMTNLTVTSDKGTTVLVYHDRIGTNFKVKTEYREIKA
uniref:Transposase n=1 Tax=Strongyloides papillosus TaxID=174720 RepID=A0A0N5BZ67_STREA